MAFPALRRLTSTACAAPSALATASTVFCVPPVPSSITVFPRSEMPFRRSRQVKPAKSVLWPSSRPFLLTMVFTEPMARAASSMTSQ